MLNLTVSQNLLNNPQLAKPRERDVLQEHRAAKDFGLFDMWLHPENYRSNGTDNHSLDILA